MTVSLNYVATPEQVLGGGPEWDYFAAHLVALWSDGDTHHINFKAHKHCTDAQLTETAWNVLREEYVVEDSTRLVLVEWREGGE